MCPLLLLGIFLSALTAAQPPPTGPSLSLTRPLSAQRIPVARIGSPFVFEIAEDTVTAADGSEISYTAVGLPSWMSLEGRTFSGEPKREQDAGVYLVTVLATSQMVKNANEQNITFISTLDPPPVLAQPLADQLVPDNPALASVFPYPSWSTHYPGVRVPRGWSFSIGLDAGTFTDPLGYAVYYDARMADGSDLPDWLKWDAGTVTFGGVAPVVPSARGKLDPPGPDVYQVVLGASDHEGYWDVEQRFSIVVQDNGLEVGPKGLGLSVAAGYSMLPAGLSATGDLYSGKRRVYAGIFADSEVRFDFTNASWLSYDAASKQLTGVAPVTVISQQNLSFVLSLTDTAQETVVAVVPVQVSPWAFISAQLPTAKLDPNGTIALDSKQYLSNRTTDPTVYAVLDENNRWLDFSDDGMLLGTRPAQLAYSEAQVTLFAVDKESNATSYATLTVDLSLPAATSPAPTNQAPRGGLSRKVKIALGVTLGALAMLILVVITVVLVRAKTYRDRPEITVTSASPSSPFWAAADAPEHYEKSPNDRSSQLPYLNEQDRDSKYEGSIAHQPVSGTGFKAKVSALLRRRPSIESWGPKSLRRPSKADLRISAPYALSPSPHAQRAYPEPTHARRFSTWYSDLSRPPTMGQQQLSGILEVSEPPTMRGVEIRRGKIRRSRSEPAGLNSRGSHAHSGSGSGSAPQSSDSIVSFYRSDEQPAAQQPYTALSEANWGAMGQRQGQGSRAVLDKRGSDSDTSRFADAPATEENAPGIPGDKDLPPMPSFWGIPPSRSEDRTQLASTDPTPYFPERRPSSSSFAFDSASADSDGDGDSEPSELVHARRVVLPSGDRPRPPSTPTPTPTTARELVSSRIGDAAEAGSSAVVYARPVSPTSIKPRVVKDMRLI